MAWEPIGREGEQHDVGIPCGWGPTGRRGGQYGHGDQHGVGIPCGWAPTGRGGGPQGQGGQNGQRGHPRPSTAPGLCVDQV